jgi:WhiB family redox-sensing transcriptional regulator
VDLSAPPDPTDAPGWSTDTDDDLIARVRAYLEPPPWHADAACRGESIDVFFPPLGAQAKAARAICGRCPVIDDCRTAAYENDEQAGVWAGETPRERRAGVAAARRMVA